MADDERDERRSGAPFEGAIREIFEAALAADPETRATLVSEACGGDRGLERRILAALDDADTLVSRGEDGDDGEAVGIPRRIGPYRLLERIGEGGMGSVFLAEQEEPVRRRVALKLIKAGMDTRSVVARFRSEQQVLAMMDHPFIARIHDAGTTERGRPYFVMEFVPGEPITWYCDRRRLGLEERLRLFVDVCGAVQHAHQKGIIHRDLKPSNILVVEEEGRALPKVIDFGIAKAIDQRLGDATVQTVVGAFVGSPDYMSPEQSGGTALDIDTRTDVYALGAVLYELLSGARPLDLASGSLSLQEMQQHILERDPPLPSRRVAAADAELADRRADARGLHRGELRRALRGDLDWIVLRAMQKDRDRRYGSASELAEDVERHLQHLPIRAGSPSRWYRLGKFVRRHRVAVAASAAVLVALVVAVVAMSVSSVRARRAAETAERAAGFLGGMFTDVELARLGTTLRTDLEERVVAGAVAGGLDDAAAEAELARFREALGDVNLVNVGLGLIDEEILAPAGERLGDEFADEPELAGRLELALGSSYQDLGLLEQAQPHLERAVRLLAEARGPGDERTLTARGILAVLHLDRGAYDEGEAILRELAEEQRHRLGAEDPATMTTVHRLATLLYRRGEVEESERLHLANLERRRRVLGPRHPATLDSMNVIGALHRARGRAEEAERIYRETLELRREVLGPDHPDTLLTQGNVARAVYASGRFEEGNEMAREVLEARRRVLGDEHPDTLLSMVNLAEGLRRMGHREEAERLMVEALDIGTRVHGRDHFLTLSTESNLALLYSNQGRWDEAERLRLDHIERVRRSLGDAHADTRRSANLTAMLLLEREPPETRRPEEALALARLATAGDGGRDHASMDTLSQALFLTGRVEEAIRNQEQALRLVPDGYEEDRAVMEATLERFRSALVDGTPP